MRVASLLSRLFAGMLLLPLVSAGLHAAEVALSTPDSAIPGKPGITYLDLARKVVPDLALTEGSYSGHKLIDLRHIGGPDMKGEPPEPLNLPSLAALPVHSGGRDRLLLLLDFGGAGDIVGGFAVLALYDVSDRVVLLDAAEVAYDTLTAFRDPAVLAVAGGTDVAVAKSSHFNAGENYAATPLILLRDDRLELIDVIYTFSNTRCSFSRSQVPSFKVLDGAGAAFATIEATVTDVTTPSDQPCEGEAKVEAATKTFVVDYKWDDKASRYLPTSDAFQKLDAENEDRY